MDAPIENFGDALIGHIEVEAGNEFEHVGTEVAPTNEEKQAEKIQGMEVAQTNEEEKIEAVQNKRHSLDVTPILPITQEFHPEKQKLAMISLAMKQGFDHTSQMKETHTKLELNVIEARKNIEQLVLEIQMAKKAEFEAASVVNTWEKEIETLRHQHAKDLTELLSNTNKVRNLEHKLFMASDSKEEEMCHALLVSKMQVNTNEITEVAKAKFLEAKLDKEEKFVEQLGLKISNANKGESDAYNLIVEWKIKAKEVEDTKSKIYTLQEKVESLGKSLSKKEKELKESEHQFNMERQQVSKMEGLVNSLSSELETVKKEKGNALENEKLATSKAKSLQEEKNKLTKDLEVSRAEETKSRKALENLTGVLQAITTELKDAKTQIEELKMARTSLRMRRD